MTRELITACVLALSLAACSGTATTSGERPAQAAGQKSAEQNGAPDAFCGAALEKGKTVLGDLGQPGTTHMKALAKAWGELADEAPAEIRADVAQIAAAFAALSEAKGQTAELEKQMTSIVEPLDRYKAWGEKHCQGF
ncbi:hypothetical protein ACIBG8_00280 [Nonomuraea sp. NPDC050556]|uniref:hypothetical protein n=1 Tax=Nonomuraea sp. NPDC050556 TaxID=3364369 RepID=UPI0037B16FB8